MKKNQRWILNLLAGFFYIQSVFAQTAVEVSAFDHIAITRQLTFPATVVNLQLAQIASETQGRVRQVTVSVGDQVQSGQLLVQLDCRAAQINQNRIKAGLKRLIATRELTKQQLERARHLSDSRSISREELDQRQTQLEADNASIEEMQASLDAAIKSVEDCSVRAPFSGIVVEKMGTGGDYANPGTPLLKLLQPDAVEVQLNIPREQLALLRQARDIRFSSAGHSYPLSLRSVLPMVDGPSLQQAVRLAFEGGSLPPGGSFGLVEFSDPRSFLPAQYVQKRDGHYGVFIYQNQQARFQPLDAAQEGQPVATSMPADTPVITNQLQLLKNQQAVKLAQ